MKENVNLKLDWASHKMAKYSCENWHYSKCMPAGKLVKIGVWENDIFIGCVIYGRGANNNMAKHLNCEVTECAELCRVALNKHKTEVTRILSISRILLKKVCPSLKILFSYADKTNQNHKGTIYIADNWEYMGERKTCNGAYYIINGKKIHGRSARAKYGSEKNFPSNYKNVESQVKHFFIKRVFNRRNSGDQLEKGSSNLTHTLQKREAQNG